MKGLGQMALPYVGWGAEFADFDADGWLDLVVANGNTLESDSPPPKKLKPQKAFLLWNRPGEDFHNLRRRDCCKEARPTWCDPAGARRLRRFDVKTPSIPE